MDRMEKQAIIDALERAEGNVKEAAKAQALGFATQQ